MGYEVGDWVHFDVDRTRTEGSQCGIGSKDALSAGRAPLGMEYGVERALQIKVADQAFKPGAITDVKRALLAFDDSGGREFVENPPHRFARGARQASDLALIGQRMDNRATR